MTCKYESCFLPARKTASTPKAYQRFGKSLQRAGQVSGYLERSVQGGRTMISPPYRKAAEGYIWRMRRMAKEFSLPSKNAEVVSLFFVGSRQVSLLLQRGCGQKSR